MVFVILYMYINKGMVLGKNYTHISIWNDNGFRVYNVTGKSVALDGNNNIMTYKLPETMDKTEFYKIIIDTPGLPAIRGVVNGYLDGVFNPPIVSTGANIIPRISPTGKILTLDNMALLAVYNWMFSISPSLKGKIIFDDPKKFPVISVFSDGGYRIHLIDSTKENFIQLIIANTKTLPNVNSAVYSLVK